MSWIVCNNKHNNMQGATVKQGEYNMHGKYEKLIKGDMKFMELS